MPTKPKSTVSKEKAEPEYTIPTDKSEVTKPTGASNNKIILFADPHFGINYPYNRDPETGISARSQDAIDHLNRIIDTAKSEGAHYILCGGDFYNRIGGVNPTIKRDLRNGPLHSMFTAGIELRIVAGNHDSPPTIKRGCDLEELEIFPNIRVFRQVSHEVLEVNGHKVAIIYLPYYSPNTLVETYQNLHPEEVIDADENIRGAWAIEMFLQLVDRELQYPEVQSAEMKILLGHYAVSDAQTSKARRYNILPTDLRLKQDEYRAKEFALCAFGHIHKGQNLHDVAPKGTEIVMLGSIDYVDWGEIFDKDDKGFYTYEVSTRTLEFCQIPCRETYFLPIHIPDGTADIPKAIREKLSLLTLTNPPEAEVRVMVDVQAGQGKLVPQDILKQVYPNAFYTWFSHKERIEGIETSPREEALDPRSLFNEFCDELPNDPAQKALIKQEGERLITTAEEDEPEFSAAEDVWIEAVEMENFNKYRSLQKVVFDKQTIAIVGPTGSGKTSVFDAIVFAIFGDDSLSRVNTIKEAFGPKGGKVTLVFHQGDKTWKVTRGLKQGSRGGLTSIAEMTYREGGGNWTVFKGGIDAITTRLGEIFGVNWEGFKNSVYIPQGEIKNFSRTGSLIIKILIRLFHLDIFEKLKAAAGEKVQEITEEIAGTTGSIDTLQAEVDTLPALQQELGELREKVVLTGQAVEEGQANLDVAEAELEEMEPVRDQYSKVEQSFAEKNNQRGKLKQETERLQRDLQLFQAKQAEKTKIGVNPREELLRLQKDRAAIQHDLETRARLDGQELDSKNRYDREKRVILEKGAMKKKALKDSEEQRASIPVDFDKDTAFGYLRDDGRFTERISRITSVEVPLAKRYKDTAMTDALKEESTKAQKNLTEIQTQTEQITPDCFALTEINKNITTIQQELKALEEELTTVEERRTSEQASVNVALQKLDPELLQKGDSLDKDIQRMQTKVKQYEDLEAFFAKTPDPAPLIAEKVENTKGIDGDITRINQELARMHGEMEKYKAKALAVKSSREKKETLGKQLESEKASIRFKEGRIVEVQQKAQQIAALNAQVAGVQERRVIFEILKENVFHPRGVPQFAITKLSIPLGLQAGEYLETLTSGRYSKVIIKPITEKANRYGFEVSVYDPETRERLVDSFSGGEQTQINAALRFAVSKMLLSRKYSAPRFLFIDEGDMGSLDADDARRDFVNVLLDLGKEYKQLILITHFPEVAESFDAKYFVTIEEGASKIRRQN